MGQVFVAPVEYRFDGMVIRPYRPGDGPALSEAVVASYDHLKETMPWARETYPVDEAEVTARKIASRYLADEDYSLALFEGDRLLGGTGFHMRQGPPHWRATEIGMWIRADASGQGLGTRLLDAMLDWGFTEWGWERIVWRCDTANLASARVAQKCGLRLEGTNRGAHVREGEEGRRDTQVYAILRPEWEALRQGKS